MSIGAYHSSLRGIYMYQSISEAERAEVACEESRIYTAEPKD